MDKKRIGTTNKSVKIAVDICMSLILLFVMAYQVTGDKYHEVLGAIMLVLFIIHNVLNYKWYGHLLKGRYTAVRVLRVIVNLATLIAIVLTGYSGIMMSQHVFSFLPARSGIMRARILHLACSYWSFVLMGIHLGLHWNMITGRIRIQNKVGIWCVRIAASAIAIYGAYLFGSSHIYTYMFMKTHFAMLDYTSPAVVIILQNLVMMISCVYIGYYLNKALIKKTNMPYAVLSAIIIIVSIISSLLSGSIAGGGWGASGSTKDTTWMADSTGTTGDSDVTGGSSMPSDVAQWLKDNGI